MVDRDLLVRKLTIHPSIVVDILRNRLGDLAAFAAAAATWTAQSGDPGSSGPAG